MKRLGDFAIGVFGDWRSSRRSPNHQIAKSHNGFTLLEMLVATVIMGIAVVGLLSNISTSLQHAGRLADYDRAALIAQRKMDELLLNTGLPKDVPVEGKFDPAATGLDGGWRARVTTFEAPPNAGPTTPVLERLQLEIWWTSGLQQRSLSLEGFRRSTPGLATAVGGGES
jgi:type II secretion system protein I